MVVVVVVVVVVEEEEEEEEWYSRRISLLLLSYLNAFNGVVLNGERAKLDTPYQYLPAREGLPVLRPYSDNPSLRLGVSNTPNRRSP